MLEKKLQEMDRCLSFLNRSLIEASVKHNLVVDQKKELEAQIGLLKARERVLQETCVVLHEACVYSRKRLKEDIEKVVTNALHDIVGDRTMGFKIVFDQSHNKVTANFFLTKEIDGKQVSLDIMNECGGGIADIVSLAIRIVLLVYHSSTLSKILILDEACTSISNFSDEILDNLAKWLRNMAEKFDMQIILVTQKQEMLQHAHKGFVVQIHDGESVVTEK